MIKFILAAVIVSVFSYVGFQIGDGYRRKYNYINELSLFNNYLKLNVLTTKDRIECVVNNYIERCKNKQFVGDLKEYLKHVKNNEKAAISNADFENIDVNLINNYFNSLGKSDSKAELKNLEEYSHYIDNIKEEQRENKKKYSAMFLKLGFLFGCLIVIIFI